MKLRVFIPTVGEDIIFDCIKRLKRTLPAHDLTVWYDLRGGCLRGDFMYRLCEETKDVVITYAQHGLIAAAGWALIYLDYDFLIYSTPDMLVHEGWFERAFKYFDDPKVGIVGESWLNHMGQEPAVNDDTRSIDGIVILRRAAVDQAGSFSPAFNGKGPFHWELYRRVKAAGWRVVSLEGLCVHGGKQHEGRNHDKEWQKRHDEDNAILEATRDRGYKGYNWWSRQAPDKQ